MAEGKATHAVEQEPTKRLPWWQRLWVWTEFGKKSGWQWLELLSTLAIPVVLAVAGYWFTSQQDARQQKLENQRAKAEQELQVQRAQDSALQAYLNGMGELLLNRDLTNPQVRREVRILARARTLTVLKRLDGERKGNVIQFLYENTLLSAYENAVPFPSAGDELSLENQETRKEAIIDLNSADMNSINLGGLELNDASLNEVDMSNANLSNASLVGADFSESNLEGADLSEVNASGAVLEGTNLSGAKLSGAELDEVDLRAANLTNANLNSADLAGATGVTKENLEKFTDSLAGTTMPDGIINAGRYFTKEFEPELSFTVGDGWRLTKLETSSAVFMEGPEGGELIFASPLQVFDPSSPSELKEISAPETPEEWVSWFQDHPNLDAADPVPVPIAGGSGLGIDVTGTSPPEDYPHDVCGQSPCVPLFRIGGEEIFGTQVGGTEIVSYVGFRDRFLITEVDGKIMVIDIAAPEDRFEEFWPVSAEVLATLDSESMQATFQKFQEL